MLVDHTFVGLQANPRSTSFPVVSNYREIDMDNRRLLKVLSLATVISVMVPHTVQGSEPSANGLVDVSYPEEVLKIALPNSGEPWLPIANAELDDQTRDALVRLKKEAKKHPSIMSVPPYRRREIHDSIYSPMGLQNSNITNAEERFIPGPGGHKTRIRIYTPKDKKLEDLPVIIYYHGGGMMMGSLEQYEPIVRRLCQKSEMIVVSVDYRMSPEYKFPTALNDSYSALQWVEKNAQSFGGDPKKLVVAGDSGGGLIAAVMTQDARDKNGPAISFQVLIYPAVGTRGNSRSLDKFATGYGFGKSELAWAYGSWVNSLEEFNSPRVQPILASDFSNLPPAYVVSAEYEIMRDDIEEYAQLLDAAGVPTQMRRFKGTIHPFMSMAGVIDAGKDVIDETALEIRRGLNKTSK
jgi:acetyl esterase